MTREYQGFTLDRFQEEALAAIDAGKDVVVAAPTGCGKTLVAEYAVQKALEAGKRVFYTGPIKALSNQKFRDFTKRFGEEKVGIVTGDVSINPHASIVIMTTEIFRNSLFDGRGGRLEELAWVIFDEVHYLGDSERGTVWEESLIFAPAHIRFVCLSATVPNADDFCQWLSGIRQREVAYVLERERPVPLDHNVFLAAEVYHAPALKNLQRTVQRLKRRGANYDRERDAHQVIMHLMKHKRLPCLFFCFSRKECEGRAKSLRNFRFLEGRESEEVTGLFDEAVARLALDPRSETVSEMRLLVRRGIAFHHAGILPGIKDVVEQMFATGLIKLLVATETFALGVNMPAASVVFAGVKKFDGVRLDWMETREYTQMAGRAGRRGMDTSGTVMVLLEPRDHEPRALKHLFSEQVEALVSSFNLSYGSICNLLGRVGGRIGETLEKSFAVHAGGRSREKMLEKMRRLLDARIRVLHRFKYLEKGELTEKGKMARLINGFEIYGCEWVFSNKLHELSDEELAVLFMAGVYEERRNDWIKGTDWEWIKRRFAPFIAGDELWRGAESAEGLDPIKGLDFGFTRAVQHWYHGGSFEDFKDLCSSSEGDIVRHFLLCCQFLRQLSHVVEDPILSERFKAVRARLFRDVMDAETNLRRSCMV